MLRLISTPDLAHKFQVVRDDGLPDVQLTLFADDLLSHCSFWCQLHAELVCNLAGTVRCSRLRNANLYGQPRGAQIIRST